MSPRVIFLYNILVWPWQANVGGWKSGISVTARMFSGPSLGPSLHRDARLRGMFSFKSAHTGVGRFPGDHPRPYAGPTLDPGLRRGERCLGRGSILSAHTGVGRYPGDHLNPLRARLWIPAFAGMSGGKVLDFNYFRAFRPRLPPPQENISNRPAAPMPPPMHMVTTPYLALRRRPSSNSVPVQRAPVMP